jgi:hypothetical protein
MRFDLELRDDHVERGPVRSLAHVAALFSAIHRHVVGLDIGSVCKRRSYVKPRDRRSARGRHDQRRPEQAARVC